MRIQMINSGVGSSTFEHLAQSGVRTCNLPTQPESGGYFTPVGGAVLQPGPALYATAGAARSWNLNADNDVSTLLVNRNMIYVAVGFTSVLGEPAGIAHSFALGWPSGPAA
jgi:hypothetical protein